MTRRCPRDFALTYQVARDRPPACLLEWFTRKVLHQVIDDFIPAPQTSSHAWLVLVSRFSFPVSYMHQTSSRDGPSGMTYNLGYRELQAFVGNSVVGVEYHAHRNVPDGRFDNMTICLAQRIVLGIPVVGQGGCFELFKTALLLEQEL